MRRPCRAKKRGARQESSLLYYCFTPALLLHQESSLLYYCFTPALLLLQDARFAAEIAWVHAQLSRAYGGGGRCLILLAFTGTKVRKSRGCMRSCRARMAAVRGVSFYLLYWYKSTNTDAECIDTVSASAYGGSGRVEGLGLAVMPVYLLYWYKSTNTDAEGQQAGGARVRSHAHLTYADVC
jgi:hypothetical protein